MIYLVHFERSSAHLLLVREFEDGNYDVASRERLQRELDYLGQPGLHEIVLLTARSTDSLLSTHGRYFSTASQMRGQWLRALQPA